MYSIWYFENVQMHFIHFKYIDFFLINFKMGVCSFGRTPEGGSVSA